MVGLYQSYNPCSQNNRKTRVTIHKTFSQFSDKSAGSYRRIPLVSLAGFFVRLVNPVPSKFIADNSQFPSRSVKNKIRPSGNHTGSSSSAFGVFVRFRGFVPSAFMAYSSRFPSRVDTNPIFVPSGDQKGFQSSAGLRVRLLCPDPSERIR